MEITPGWRRYECEATARMWDIHFNINVGLLQPNRANWRTEEILTILKNREIDRKKLIVTIRDHIMISDSIRTHIELEKLPLEIIYIDGDYKSVDSDISTDELTSLIIDADYVFLSSFDFIEKDDITDEAGKILRENIEQFILLEEMKMPDGTFLWIYGNRIKWLRCL